MNRRQYIALLGVAGLPGCTGSGNDGGGGSSGSDGGTSPTAARSPTTTATATPDRTPTESPTPTETPTAESPEILFVNLISAFEDFGDVEDNLLNEASQNSDILVGWRERTWVHDGTYATTTQVEIRNAQGDRVAVNSDSEEQIVEGDGPQEWEGAMSFRASWDPGEYTAEVVVRDDVTDKVSEPATGTFTITKAEPKLEIIRHSRYSGQYDAGVRGVAKNVSDETLSYAEVSVVFLNGDGQQVGDNIDNTTNLAPEREWQFDLSHYGDDDFASYELSVDWTV